MEDPTEEATEGSARIVSGFESNPPGGKKGFPEEGRLHATALD